MSIRCVLFWLDGILSKYEDDSSLLDGLSIGVLDKFVEEGCVGQLLSLQQHDTTSLNFSQLLGFESDSDHKVTYNTFKEKYSNLSLRLITSSQSLLQDCNTKGFDSILVNNVNCKDLLNEINKPMKEKVEMVIIHLEPVSKGLEDRRALLTTLDQTVQSLKQQQEQQQQFETYINIVISFDSPNVTVPLTEQQQSSQQSIPSTFIPPKQSTQFYNGKPVEPRQTSPMFAIYSHAPWTRKDESKSFRLDQFIRGCNGKILTIQYLKELAFKLGKIPKYGA
ncbi:hypothetical protein PPL_05328 [Heterostelium album PN500]|uniref:Uncharacterized protein n=1 Tax=Heterostelium pallidum (strain ATCC 26659 / Pp 5 / PN500) TaxID=670386 RepID=D3BBD8_HETP5|nr:hypothetical protein PPL_05328 [Heterostelium album PN500]EFA81345.1 hypothetical protein PPL_05328 [Heterostelium album PN500]|eukprot:XP_020433463.1 hypothetical protein PPL_05328 [Heterostelium album PN500]